MIYEVFEEALNFTSGLLLLFKLPSKNILTGNSNYSALC